MMSEIRKFGLSFVFEFDRKILEPKLITFQFDHGIIEEGDFALNHDLNWLRSQSHLDQIENIERWLNWFTDHLDIEHEFQPLARLLTNRMFFPWYRDFEKLVSCRHSVYRNNEKLALEGSFVPILTMIDSKHGFFNVITLPLHKGP